MSVSKVSTKFPSLTFQSISTTSKVISCHLLRYITFHETKMPNLLLSARLQETITMEGTREGNTETLPKRHKMVRQTVTVKDKTKTKGSVSERKKDKSQADSCWRLRRDIGETSCHWQRYVRVLLMLCLFSLCWHRHEKAQRCPTRGCVGISLFYFSNDSDV